MPPVPGSSRPSQGSRISPRAGAAAGAASAWISGSASAAGRDRRLLGASAARRPASSGQREQDRGRSSASAPVIEERGPERVVDRADERAVQAIGHVVEGLALLVVAVELGALLVERALEAGARVLGVERAGDRPDQVELLLRRQARVEDRGGAALAGVVDGRVERARGDRREQQQRERDAPVADGEQAGGLGGGALGQQPAGQGVERHAHADARQDLRQDDPGHRRARHRRQHQDSRADQQAAGGGARAVVARDARARRTRRAAGR